MKERIVLFAVLLCLTGAGGYVLSRWERTPHVYSYGDGLKWNEEQKIASNGEREHKKKEQEQTPPPQESQEPDEDAPQNDAKDPDKTPDPRQSANPDVSARPDASGIPDVSAPPGDQGEPADGPGEQPGDQGGGSGGQGGEPGGTGEPGNPGGPGGSQSPAATDPPGPEPTASPAPTPFDEPVALAVAWPDKDNIKYGQNLPLDSLKVTVTFQSGKTRVLSAAEYTAVGDNSSSAGQHTLRVKYIATDGDRKKTVWGSINYTLNNYTVGIKLDWGGSNPLRRFRGEDLSMGVFSVYLKMADGSRSEQPVSEDDYTISGVNPVRTGEKQIMKVDYQKGSESYSTQCEVMFNDAKLREVHIYGSGTDAKTREEVYTTNGAQGTTLMRQADMSGRKYKRTDSKTYLFDGQEWMVSSIEITVNGVDKTAPYTIRDYDFDVVVTRHYIKKS